jgi:hypothetical protein
MSPAPFPIQLEPEQPTGYVDPRLAAVTAAPPAPQQLTPEDAAAIQGIAGVDPVKAKALADAAAARVPPRDTGGAVVLDPIQQPQAPQYGMAVIPTGSSSTSSSSGISAASEKKIREAHEEVINAQADALKAAAPQMARDAAATAEIANLAEQRAKSSAEYEIKSAQLRDENVKNTAQARQKLEADVDEYTKAGNEVDPQRVWHRMDTGSKIAYALAAGLMGFSQGLQGRGGNPVVEMLQNAQDRDLRAQEVSLNAKARGIQLRDSLYSRLIEEGHSKEVSLLATQDASNRKIGDQIAAAQVKAQNTPAEELMNRAAADWTVKTATEREQLEKAVARNVTSSSTVQKQAVMVDQNGMPPGPAGVPGTRVVDERAARAAMGNDAQAKQVREVAAQLQRGQDAVKNMISIRQRVGTEVWNDEDIAQYEAEKQAAVGAFTQMANSGTLNAGEYPRYAALLPDLGLHLNDAKRLIGAKDPSLLKLQGTLKAVQSSANSSLRPYGLALGGGESMPSRQVRGDDGRVYNVYGDGRVSRL